MSQNNNNHLGHRAVHRIVRATVERLICEGMEADAAESKALGIVEKAIGKFDGMRQRMNEARRLMGEYHPPNRKVKA